jgi:hypothetical protein
MNRTIFIIIGLSLCLSILILNKYAFDEKEENQNLYLGKDGLLYIAGTDKLFNGIFKDTANFIIEFNVVNGVKNGIFKTYFLNGQLEKEGYIKNNKNFGEWRYYYENGQLETVGNFDENIPEGQWRSFYNTGIIKILGTYKNGKQHGAWEYYDLNGNMINIFYYEDGNFAGLEISTT